MAEHDCEIVSSFTDDWIYAECSCGWRSPPLPGHVEATDEISDHRVAVALGEGSTDG